MDKKDREEFLEFTFPNLNSYPNLGDHPYIYILTEQGDIFESVFQTLKQLGHRFLILSMPYDFRNYKVRAWWQDNRAYYVPKELLCDENGQVLDLDSIPDHFMERAVESWEVDVCLAGVYTRKSLEYIPRVGWVEKNTRKEG